MDFSSELLRTILADSSDACILFEKDADSLAYEPNQAALDLFAITENDRFLSFYQSGIFNGAADNLSEPSLNQLVSRAFAGQNFSGQIALQNTVHRAFQAYLRLQYIDQGDKKYVFARIRDIRSEREIKRALSRQRQNLQTLLEQTPIGVVISRDGQVLWANSRAQQLVEVHLDGNLLDAFVVPQDNEIIEQALSTQGSLMDYALQMYGPGGSTQEIYLTSMFMEFDDKQARLDWLTDIRELKETEKALIEARDYAQAADSAKSDFLARMSHEIRTPMNAILGMCYLCLKTHLTVKQRDYLVKIQDAAQMLMGIINDVLDFSKTSSDGLTLEKAPIYLESLLESIGTVYAPKAEKKGLEFLIRIDPALPQVMLGDALRLSQVMQVLVSNAIKFTEKGDVTIRADLVEQDARELRAHFSVSDSGIGMSEEEQHKLFQPFSQADDYTTRRYGGTGLGLAISKSMVELMGGEIWVDSAPGLGSTFHFTLRLDQESGDGLQEHGLPEYSGLEILVVDDNSAASALLAELLEAQNFRCSTAANGRQALLVMEEAAARGRHFRFVFVDWKMDGLDGIETAHLIQSAFPGENKPIIILVSAAAPEFSREFLQANGISDFLPKPVSNATLMNIVNRLLDGKHKTDALPAPKVKAPPTIRGARVLLVEDNEINQEIALSLLQGEGMRVDVAGNGQEAVEIIHKHGPDYYQLIFMDIQMPVMDGLQAAAEIRSLGHSRQALPIVAMTAHARASDREKSLESGMNDHITKPLDPDKLHQTLAEWIDPAKVAEPLELEQESALRELNANARLQEADPIFGLSLDAGLESVGGNQALYAKLLRKFRESCHFSDIEIQNAIENNDSELAVRLAHTVKGVSASLGMIALSRVAGTAEKVLKDLKNLKDVDVLLLKEFSDELHGALNAVNVYLGDQGESAPEEDDGRGFAEGSIDPDLATEIIGNLRQLRANLETDWVTVISRHERVVNLLANQGYRSQVYNLTAAVENFDVPQAVAAAKLLEDAILAQSSIVEE